MNCSDRPMKLRLHPGKCQRKSQSLRRSALWHAGSVSKAGKFVESQVWIDKGLYRQIEAFNLR